MHWQIREDLLSLFTRGKGTTNRLDSIDGLRSISNLAIILFHMILLFSALLPSYPHAKWQEYLQSAAFPSTNILVLALEIFFMLSAFLLTHKLLTQWNQKFPRPKFFLCQEHPISIVKRALRFWPGMLLVTLIMFLFGEPRDPNSGVLFEFFRHISAWIFCQNYIGLENFNLTFAPLWSVSLDMQIHIILPLVLYFLYSCRKFISLYHSLAILLMISIIRSLMVFDPVAMSVLPMAYRYPSLPLMSPNHTAHWIQTNYNVTFLIDHPEPNPLMLFMNKLYLPLEARFGSFIVGAMLAIKLSESKNHDQKARKWKKFVYFALICFQIFISIQGSELVIPPDVVLNIVIAFSRQLFAIGQAFILFTALCPSTHPYHSSWMKTFLSLPIWIPLSKLSYLVYLIHFRIAFELIFGGPLRFLETYSVTYASLISLLIVLLIAEPISCIWFVLVEKPVERAIQGFPKKTHAN